MVTDWTYNEDEGWWEWIEEEEQYLEKEIEDEVYVIEKDLEIPTYDDAADQDFQDFWQYLNYYRWTFNFFIIGIPYLVVVILLNAYNIWFNVYLNDFWAEGNVYLLLNSLFSVL